MSEKTELPKEKASQKTYDRGWHKDNPNHAVCGECGSKNLEFNWWHDEPKGVRCLDCGWEEHDPK